jgi:CRISPR system Cascade subunit CasA
VLALLSLQTQQGFSGRDNYGVVRMNGGFGNRPGIGVARSLDWASHVLRDVHVAVAQRPGLLSESMPYREDGLALVWLEPWDGTESLAMTDLDPFFIEVCRRVRFEWSKSALAVRSTSTKAPRIAGKELQGNTGDLWTPVDRARGAALTLPGTGFHYARMAQLLFEDDWIRPAALEVVAADGAEPLVIARALVRGQGKTEGMHERVVAVPAKARGLFSSAAGRLTLGTLAKHRVEQARALRLKVLKPAICAFIQGGADDLRLDDDRGNWLLDQVDASVDADFFPRLFSDVELDAEEAETRFQRRLVELGRHTLERALASLPTSASRKERATAAAEQRFFGGARKSFPLAFKTPPGGDRAEEARP